MANSSFPTLWALVLAGGDGTRLRSLTRLIAGAPIPKQYCRLVGDRSLLEETLARLRGLVPATRTLAVVNRDHLPLASAQLATLPARNVVVQPRNRDTGPGILLPLLALARRSPDATVAVFPSDHYVANDAGRDALTATYAQLPPWNFSHDLLAHVTPHLLLLRATGLGWSDWGTVSAIERTLATLGRTPPWREVAASLAATA